MPKALLSCLFLSTLLAISGAGCGLMDPTYTPNVTAQQNAIAQLRKEKQEAAAESAALKAQIPALQSAHAAKQSELDTAKAQLAMAQATAGTPPEATAALMSLVSSVQMEVAASKGAIDDTNALRAMLASRHKQLATEEDAREAALKSYKITSAAQAGEKGLTMAEGLGLTGGAGAALAAVIALLRTFGKSRSQPEIDQQWDRITELERQNAALAGRLGTALPTPPFVPTPPTHSVI